MNWDFLNQLDNYIKTNQYRLVNAVLVYEHNNLIFEGYYNKTNENSKNQIKSVWKSILSLTLGLCLEKGLIDDIHDPISKYLQPFSLNIHPRHSAITIHHLLTMTSGIYWNGGVKYHCPMLEQMRRSKDWIAHIAESPVVDYPGSRFVYKEWDVILLSAIIGAVYGSAHKACVDFLYNPLEINSDTWTKNNNVSYPSWGKDTTSDLSAKDMAKIGQLMLNNGTWNGRQIIASEYVKRCTTPSAADANYGLLWWLTDHAFHAKGYSGQELNIYPIENTVAVVQATVTSSCKTYPDICEKIIGVL